MNFVDYEETKENFRKVEGFSLHRTDPHGFWIIRADDDKTPKELADQYFTSTRAALIELSSWVKNHGSEAPKKNTTKEK